MLSVFGDSYAGVFSLLSRRCVRVSKFKGASARVSDRLEGGTKEPMGWFVQGLANKNSKLQVGQKLLDEIDSLRPRKVLLLFGHVDVAINYLW